MFKEVVSSLLCDWHKCGAANSTITSSDNSATDPSMAVSNRKLMAYSDRSLISRSLPLSTAEAPALSGGSPREKKSISDKFDDQSVAEGNLEGRKEGQSLRSDAGLLTGAASTLSNVWALLSICSLLMS